MTILEIHTIFNLVADKDRVGYHSHEDIDRLLDQAQMEYFAQLIGNYKQYQAGRPIAAVTHGQTNRTLEDLNPFKSSIEFFKMPYDPTTAPYGVTDGILALPSDFEHMDALISYSTSLGVTRQRPIEIVNAEEWANRADSALIPVSQNDAIAMFDGRGGTLNGLSITGKHRLRFLPKDISGKLLYFRRPAKPFYSYTLNETTRVETHNANASTNLEWLETAQTNILIRALQLAGVVQADQMLYQAMGQNKMSDE